MNQTPKRRIIATLPSGEKIYEARIYDPTKTIEKAWAQVGQHLMQAMDYYHPTMRIAGEPFTQEPSTGAAYAMQLFQHQGPLPPAAELIQYEQALPGVANRIVVMAEQTVKAANSATLSESEVNNATAQAIHEDAKSVKRGQYLYAGIAAGCLIAAFFLAFSGRTEPAVFFGIFGLINAAGVLIVPSRHTKWFSRGPKE